MSVEGEAGAGSEPVRGHGPVHETGGRVRGAHDQGRGQHAGGGVQARVGHETVVQTDAGDGRAKGRHRVLGGGGGPTVSRARRRRAARAVHRSAGRGRRVADVRPAGRLGPGHRRVLLEAVRRLQPVRGRGDRRPGRPGGRGGHVQGRVRAGRPDGPHHAPAHRPDPARAHAQLLRVPVPGVPAAPAGPRRGQARVRRGRGRDRRHRRFHVRRLDAHPAAHPRQPDHMDPRERRRVVRHRRRGHRRGPDRGRRGRGGRPAAAGAVNRGRDRRVHGHAVAVAAERRIAERPRSSIVAGRRQLKVGHCDVLFHHII